jgi:hypothetical protein
LCSTKATLLSERKWRTKDKYQQHSIKMCGNANKTQNNDNFVEPQKTMSYVVEAQFSNACMM